MDVYRPGCDKSSVDGGWLYLFLSEMDMEQSSHLVGPPIPAFKVNFFSLSRLALPSNLIKILVNEGVWLESQTYLGYLSLECNSVCSLELKD